MKKVTSLLMALILSVTILMGSIPMNASAATTEVISRVKKYITTKMVRKLLAGIH